ncbi:MurR/RpiR family transcriptional regulator [Luteibacter jiangsuensis]|uniref:MurR/RpiR family transcriptional regulator n=1 Tax=Luteibacter jiangsuensis TaxID=637577 RepID=A0ABX0Q4W1_9GAMM|nr:MurR/RpiR family transcriptional regulator [Luteibacter jiangsuensis]NID05560.1 MurR/RpiR family transcriptional regulator [Luteibacter jiangsuensis]
MSPLVKIRSERDRMSAVERRIADFILENAQLLRDYSSQQLASALGISQSSVVKFTQKLGFRGYPDLKYSVGEAIGRTEETGDGTPAREEREGGDALGATLWQRKSRAEEATRLINDPATLRELVAALDAAGKVFLIGVGEDELHARGFAARLSLLGIVAIRHVDVGRMAAQVAMSAPGDLLIVFSEHGKHPALVKLARYFREHRGRVATVTRHTSNPLRALSDVSLAVAAHDDASYVQSLIYQSTVQQLLDTVFVHLCEGDEARHARLVENLDRIHQMLGAT